MFILTRVLYVKMDSTAAKSGGAVIAGGGGRIHMSVRGGVDLIVVPTITYSHSQMLRDIDALANAYPGLIRHANAGFSVEGRELPLVYLGTGEKQAFFCAAHHARDYITSAFLMYTLCAYARAAADNRKIGGCRLGELLARCTMAVMPMVNPDGVALVQGGLKAVKHKARVRRMTRVRPAYEQWMANINGVDLARQYPALWEKKYAVLSAPASELYNGESPAAEPEVAGVMKVCQSHAFLSAFAFYAKGETIDYADGGCNDEAAFLLAKRLSAVTGYALNTVCDNQGVYAAGFECWFRREFSRPALHINVSPALGGAMPHRDRDFFPLIWDKTEALCAEALSAVCRME